VKATVDTGNITLTVNGILSASTNYAGGATASTVAEGLAGGVTANSPVNVTAVNDALFLEAKQPGSASNYAYTLQTSSYDTQDFSSSSFLNPAISGNLQGGADQSSSGNAVVYSYTVPAGGYDGDGNLLNYTDWVMGTWTFSYDSLNRLVGGSDNQSGNSNGYYCWGYDPFGNRTVQTGSTQLFQVGSPTCQAPSNASTTITWANYNTNNQFTNTSRGVGYDSAGNVTNDGVNQYLYDGEGRVCAVLNQPFTGLTVMTGYIYGANGKRVAKGSITTMNCDPTINGFTPANDYVLGLGGEQLTEMGMDSNGSMAWEHTNVYAAGTLLATYDQNGLHFHLTDPLGTRRTQTDYAGVLEQTCSSLPFGDSLSCTGSIQFPTEHHFTGKERDSETGLDYFGARYNASNMGRFMSPDPGQDSGFEHMDDPQSWNGYAYARNNPLTVTDPDGRNYVVCDGAGKNCANLSDSQYDEYRKQNQNQTVTASGAIYQNNDDGSSTKVGQATYYNEKDDQAAQMLANTGRQLSDPRTIGAFYGASALLGAGASASPLIGGTGASLTTLSIPMGLQPGAVVGGFILTEHAVEQAMERGVTLSEIVEAVSGVAKSNPQNGWDSVQRFYTSTCEVRVNMVTGTIVTVINKIQR
jgi:RHS repeat-associated protein